MSSIRRASLLLACATVSVVLTSCSANVLEPNRTVQIDVPASEFVRDLAGAVSIPFVLRNLGDQSVGVPQCGPAISVEVERLSGRRWVGYSSTFCIAIYPVGPVSLAHGAERAGAISVRQVGMYRILLEVDGRTRISPTFAVR